MNERARPSSQAVALQADAYLGSFLGALAVGALVLWAVAFGFSNYAAALKPQWVWPIHWLAGLLAAAFAFALAYATATARLEAEVRQDPQARWAGMSSFVVLLLISALGAMNSLFFLLETDDVVKNRVEQVRTQLSALETKGLAALRNPSIESRRTEVEGLLRQLQQRIERGEGTPNSCGIGRNANATIRSLAQVLPGYGRVPFAEVTACTETGRLASLYKEQERDAWERFEGLREYRDNRGKEREQLAQGLRDSIRDHRESLKVSSISGQEGLRAVQGNLQLAATSYADLKAGIETLTGQALEGLPSTLDIDDVMTLGNAGHVIKNLMKRLDHFQTWLYIVLALVADWLLVSTLAAYRSRAHGTPQKPMPTAKASEDTEVRYLWEEAGA